MRELPARSSQFHLVFIVGGVVATVDSLRCEAKPSRWQGIVLQALDHLCGESLQSCCYFPSPYRCIAVANTLLYFSDNSMRRSTGGRRPKAPGPPSRPHPPREPEQPTATRQSSRPAAPKPEEIAAKASRRAELLRERIDVLDVELSRLRGEMDAAKKGSAARQRYKDRAKQVLRQKKTLERRMEQALNQSFNMAVIGDAIEARSAAEADAALYESMRASLGVAEEGAFENREQLQDAMEENAEIQQLLSDPLDGSIPGLDDETLEAELEEELRAAGLSAHGRSTPSVPSPSEEEFRVAGVQAFDGPVGPFSRTVDDEVLRPTSQEPHAEPVRHNRANRKRWD